MQQDVGLGSSTSPSSVLSSLDALVVVVDRDRQDPLRLILTDDVVVQELVDLARRREFTETDVGGLGQLFFDDLVAEIDALVADVHAGACDQLLDLLLRLAAEGTLQEFPTLTELGHAVVPLTVLADGRDRPAVVDHITRFDHLIDDAIRFRLSRGHHEVAIGVGGDLLNRLTGVVCEYLFEALFMRWISAAMSSMSLA